MKIVNQSGHGIVVDFLGNAPCNPSTISIPDGGEQLFTWESTVGVDKYFFVVSQDPATDSGGNVRATTGTIDIVVMG